MSEEKDKGMSLIVKTVTRITAGFILLYGIYIVVHGHVSPGGGFAGGVIMALSFILLMLAYGQEMVFRKMSKAKTAFIERIGAVLFLTIALLGFAGGYFFVNFIAKGKPFSLFGAGTILLSNIAICFKVGAGIFAIFIVFVLIRMDLERKK